MECQSSFRKEKIRLKFSQWMEIPLQKISLGNIRISFRIADKTHASGGQKRTG
jgi:hypothetical protein